MNVGAVRKVAVAVFRESVRDRVPYSQGDRMMLGSGGGWMVEGSLPRLMRDYNQLVQSYNSGARI